MDRPRGVTVYPMPEKVTGPHDRYAVVFRGREARMVHTEGVGYLVNHGRPWTWNDYDKTLPTFTVRDLTVLSLDVEGVDLADWVRTFGARLESNFHQVYAWATGA